MDAGANDVPWEKRGTVSLLRQRQEEGRFGRKLGRRTDLEEAPTEGDGGLDEGHRPDRGAQRCRL